MAIFNSYVTNYQRVTFYGIVSFKDHFVSLGVINSLWPWAAIYVRTKTKDTWSTLSSMYELEPPEPSLQLTIINYHEL